MMQIYTKSKCIREYKEELERQLNPYEQWIAKEEDDTTYSDTSDKILPYRVFTMGEGMLHKATHIYLEKAFEDENVLIVYGDEDVREADGTRKEPWFKPKWSPDTFVSHFYMGSMVAVRDTYCNQYIKTVNEISVENIYALLTTIVNELVIEGISMEQSILHIPRILYHREEQPAMMGMDASCDLVKNSILLQEIRRTGLEKLGITNGRIYVSMIIPSKDNSRMLEKCLVSIKKYITNDMPYEIIVVDNGSCLEEQNKVTKLSEEYGFRYLFEIEEFNFARMCNKGAKEAVGDHILLLNDDVEFTHEGWLYEMLEVARRNHVGAVGMKLLYPEEKLIQHVGVSNIKVGPVHKLTGETDEVVHYYGNNRGKWNRLAVTGACLLVKKKLYQELGGLCEELAVAYNDVDFCFRLHERGYYNVVCNHIEAIHHESYSRGNDMEEEDKLERLNKERSLLYERNPFYKDYDPYYSKNLIQDTDYYGCILTLSCEEEGNEQVPIHVGAKKFLARNKIHPYYYIEDVSNEDGMVMIKGWSFMKDVDNACYETALVLENESKTAWSFAVLPKYRKDVTMLVENQVHNELSGMIVRFQATTLPHGEYSIQLCKKNKITHEIQYIDTGKRLINI
ncbi:MAG: glycosyltransferase [Eubacteriales bacterium]